MSTKELSLTKEDQGFCQFEIDHMIQQQGFSFLEHIMKEGKKVQKMSFLKVQLHKQKLFHLIVKNAPNCNCYVSFSICQTDTQQTKH